MSSDNRINQEIDALEVTVERLSGDMSDDGTAWELLNLTQINNAIESLTAIRNGVVHQLRQADHTWESIAASTGVPISTWRRRHSLYLLRSDA